jgi:quinol monooxygenase YgiN
VDRVASSLAAIFNSEVQDQMSNVHTCCPIVELRQYTLHPGKRDVLIDLFDREFVETQEAVGMKIIGQFRDLDDPNRFVWLRGFQDMATRAQSLQAFYGGPVWKANRDSANDTMVDSDNVLLLRPVHSDSAFSLENSERPPRGATEIPNAIVTATIYYFDLRVDKNFIDFFERGLKPILVESGASLLACLVTEERKNTFTALPVREDENVFVWFSRFGNTAALDHYSVAMDQSRKWREEVAKVLKERLKKPPEVLKLSPTSRSHLR